MSEFIADSLAKVRDANPTRQMRNLDRRLFKLYEEAGEFAQAYLHVTSNANAKGKTWADVREEGIDTLIPILDVVLTPTPEMAGDLFESLAQMAREPVTFPDRFEARDGLTLFVYFGEFVESFVAATRDINQVSWQHFRASGIAAAKKLVNMIVQEMPDQAGTTETQRYNGLTVMLDAKLEKWRQNRVTRKQTTDDSVPEDDV